MKKMRNYFLFMVLLAMLCLGAYADRAQGVLKGRIFDAGTKEGLGGIRVLVTGAHSRTSALTDDFGFFLVKLAPGEYVAKIEEIPQSIGFVILPGKTALLDIPLKASEKPNNNPIPYTVKYAQLEQAAQAGPPEKKVQPFIEPASSAQNAPASTPQAVAPTQTGSGAYPMQKLVDKPATQSQTALQTIAVVQFKDSTGRGLGLEVAQDIADSLFDQGKAKIVGPDSVSAAIGGEPADPLNGAFGTWVSKRLGADVVVLGRIKETRVERHQYLFIVTEQAVITSAVVVMDSKTGNILRTFTETGRSGLTGTSGNKDRYYEDQTIANLFAKASNDLAQKISEKLLNEGEQN